MAWRHVGHLGVMLGEKGMSQGPWGCQLGYVMVTCVGSMQNEVGVKGGLGTPVRSLRPLDGMVMISRGWSELPGGG